MPWLALLLVFLCQAAPQDWQAQGSKALDEKRYTDAVAAFSKAAEADPKDYAAFFNRALAKSMLADDAGAIADYQHVLELKPGLFEAELNLGILLIRDKRAAEAIPVLKDAASKKPKEFRPTYYLAEALLASGQDAEAEKAFNTALEIDAHSAAAQSGLARALLRLDRLDESASHFKVAGDLDPTLRDESLRLAERYEDKKQFEQALAIYNEFPNNAGAQERSGQILLSLGRAADAVPHLEAAVKQSPTLANRTALAAAYANTKEFDKAAALLAEALRAEPGNFELRMMAGRLLRDARKFPEAAAQFFQATKIKPDSVEAWNDLAAVLVLAEEYPQAVAALDRVQALGAATAATYYFRALSLDHMNQYQPALEAYRKFLEMSAGKRPDEEFKARQRARILEREIKKR